METLNEQLKTLGFYALSKNVDDIVAMATQKRLSPRQLLEYVIDLEAKERFKKSLEGRLGRSKIGRFKSMADFDWAWPKQIDREQVEAALRGEFLKEQKNIVLVAAQGLGKTMIARNICHQAILSGQSALFITASQLLLDLSSKDSASALERRLRHYQRPALLCIDEVGYLSYDNRNADLLFQVVSRRYENKSLILTTNLPFSQWPEIFPNAACTTALIDRVVHHSEIIIVEGDSYRRREAEEAKRTLSKKSRSLEKQKASTSQSQEQAYE